VLVDELSPVYLAPLALFLPAVGKVAPDLVNAFRTGEGVPYAAYGKEAVAAQAALNRPAFADDLVSTWIPAIPELADRLSDTDQPATVADVGCGVGWSSIEMAKAFPHLRIDGYDADEESITQAREHAAEQGVDDRVTFEVSDLHDMG